MFQRMKENYRRWYRDVAGTLETDEESTLANPDDVPPYETPFSTKVGVGAFVFAIIVGIVVVCIPDSDRDATHDIEFILLETFLLVVAMGSFIMSVITKLRIHTDWYSRQIMKRLDMQIQLQLEQAQYNPARKQTAVASDQLPPKTSAAQTATKQKDTSATPKEEEFPEGDSFGFLEIMMIVIAIVCLGAFLLIVLHP